MDDLVKYRLESAAERLESAKILYDNGQWKDSIGRSYYAIFTAVRALLATVPVDFAKHAGVIQYFHREYIKLGKMDVRYGKILDTAFQIRNNCDYNDFYLVSESEAKEQLEDAEDFLNMIKEYIGD